MSALVPARPLPDLTGPGAERLTALVNELRLTAGLTTTLLLADDRVLEIAQSILLRPGISAGTRAKVERLVTDYVSATRQISVAAYATIVGGY